MSTLFPADKYNLFSRWLPVAQIVVFLFPALSTIKPALWHDGCIFPGLCVDSAARNAMRLRLIFWPTGASTIHGWDFVPHVLEPIIWIGFVETSTAQDRFSSATEFYLIWITFRGRAKFLEINLFSLNHQNVSHVIYFPYYLICIM